MGRQAQDRQLARRCVQGDESAWRHLVDQYTPMVYSLCVHRGLAPVDAEDVCQEVMLSALRALSTYEGCLLSTWLFRITQRRLADHYRSPHRRLLPTGLADDTTRPGVTPSVPPEQGEDLIRHQEGERIRSAIQQLSDPPRSVILAYYLAQMPVREIARELNMPENTVKSHLHRGRLELRQAMERG